MPFLPGHAPFRRGPDTFPVRDAPLAAESPLAVAQERLNQTRAKLSAAGKKGYAMAAPKLAAHREAWRAERAAREAAKPPKLPKPPKPKNPRAPHQLDPGVMIGLQGAGVSASKIAKVLHVDRQTVARSVELVPGGPEQIAEWRAQLKGYKIQRAHQSMERHWNRFDKELDTGAAKDVDAITRSLLALEKIEAAASGEAHASGPAPAPVTNGDLIALVQVLIGGGGA